MLLFSKTANHRRLLEANSNKSKDKAFYNFVFHLELCNKFFKISQDKSPEFPSLAFGKETYHG